MKKSFHVYIMSSRSRTLYIGFTGDLMTRVWQHKTGAVPGFTSRYKITRLVYFVEHATPGQGIEREKELKNWLREKKINLVNEMNPGWDDLSAGWYDTELMEGERVREFL